MKNIQLPTVHLNGTSKEDLRRGYDAAAEALEDFVDSWGAIEFNARDYYIEGPEAYPRARDERDEVAAKIREVREYLQAIREHLYTENPRG